MRIISEEYYYINSYTGHIILIECNDTYGFIGILRQEENIAEQKMSLNVTDDLDAAKQLYNIIVQEKVFPVLFDSVIDDFISEYLMEKYIDI